MGSAVKMNLLLACPLSGIYTFLHAALKCIAEATDISHLDSTT